MECIICLEDINSNEYYKFTCCKNTVHESCLNSWVIKNIDNKNTAKCFICSQNNVAIQNIISHYFNNNDEIIYDNNNDEIIYDNSNDEIIYDNSNNIINYSNVVNNNNVVNYIIVDISNNIQNIQPQIESKPLFFLKLTYSILTASIMLGVLVYISR